MRFYTAGCGNKMAGSVTGPRAVNELGGPVIPGKLFTQCDNLSFSGAKMEAIAYTCITLHLMCLFDYY